VNVVARLAARNSGNCVDGAFQMCSQRRTSDLGIDHPQRTVGPLEAFANGRKDFRRRVGLSVAASSSARAATYSAVSLRTPGAAELVD
jgi:hypothetical protein